MPHHPRHLRLLEHELRHEDGVGVARPAPRERALVPGVPAQQTAAEGASALRERKRFCLPPWTATHYTRHRCAGCVAALFAAATRALTRRRATYHRILPSHLGLLRATLQKGDVAPRGRRAARQPGHQVPHAELVVAFRALRGRRAVAPPSRAARRSSRRDSASTRGTCWSRRSWRRASSRRRWRSTRRTTSASAVRTGCGAEHCRAVVDEILAQLGSSYAVRNVLALARYFFPVSLIPRRWRRHALELGDDAHEGSDLLHADRARLPARRASRSCRR